MVCIILYITIYTIRSFEHFFNSLWRLWHGIDKVRMKTIYSSGKLTIMKQLLLIVAMATVMVSCKNKTTDQTQVLAAAQQADYNEFVQWKAAKAAKEKTTPVRTVTKVVYVPAKTYAPAVAQTTKKKGWSKAAKGTAIGAGSGAVLGAIINKKNRAAGAAIGAVLGGGVGYGIGRSQDKKDGR
jgi:uncharacterized protein YcfJ